MKENNESWVLFQLFDRVLERWSPIYCGATKTSVDLEIKDMEKKTNDRPVMLRYLGVMSDGVFVADESADVFYGNAEVLNENVR